MSYFDCHHKMAFGRGGGGGGWALKKDINLAFCIASSIKSRLKQWKYQATSLDNFDRDQI